MENFSPSSNNVFFADHIFSLAVTRNRGFEMRHPNGRAKNSFIYTEKGALLYSFSDGSQIEAAEGEMVFLPEKTAHTSRYLQDGSQVRIVHFDVARGALPDYLRAPVKLSLHNAGELLEGFFEDTCPHPYRCAALLYELLYQVDRARGRTPIKFKKLHLAIEMIHARPEDNRRIADYAELCGMSEAGFRRLFREYTGVSPVDYRNALRLERAKLLLAGGDYNVSEAAEAVGFSNLSFFIRLYKRKYGRTPKNG